MPWSDQVDAEPVRRHVRELLAGGMNIVQIQNLSGIDRTAIRVMLGDFPGRPASKQVRALTASRLLRTRLDVGSAIAGMVPAIGTRRRLEALQAIGWPGRELAARLGFHPGSGLQVARRDLVLATTAQAVARLYEKLADTPGPSNSARERAASRGYLPPIWWDDDTIDNPPGPAEDLAGELLDEIAVERLMSGTLRLHAVARPAELVEAVRRLAVQLTDGEIGDRIGRSERTVIRIRQANGIPPAQPRPGAERKAS